MRLFETLKDSSIDPFIDKLLFTLSVVLIVLLSPYFVWRNELVISRITHIIGNAILLYMILKHHNTDIYNIGLTLFFLLISIYTMVGGTQYHHITYIPLLGVLFITLRRNEQLRIFNYFVTIIAVVYSIGLVSYLLSIFGLNIRIGTAISSNPAKWPYYVYFGHIRESGLSVYRFCSIFDEAGVVGTLSGLILSAIGISTRNIKSLIILLAGLVSFSLAFYIILIFNLIFYLNIKKLFIVVIVLAALIYLSGNLFSDLISSRLSIQNGRLAGDNRTAQEFDDYYSLLIEKGGKDLFFGKGGVGADKIEEIDAASTYKLIILKFGIIGAVLILCFYALCVYSFHNSKKGWFLFFIFIISAYQRPDLFMVSNIIMFIGGLRYLDITSEIANTEIIKELRVGSP